jgi:hypothetical protein
MVFLRVRVQPETRATLVQFWGLKLDSVAASIAYSILLNGAAHYQYNFLTLIKKI